MLSRRAHGMPRHLWNRCLHLLLLKDLQLAAKGGNRISLTILNPDDADVPFRKLMDNRDYVSLHTVYEMLTLHGVSTL